MRASTIKARQRIYSRQCMSWNGHGVNMLSSLNAYGGLSANQLLTLFGANASSASASATSTSPAQPTPESLTATPLNDPASSIKAILAQSKIGWTTSDGGRSVTDTVEAAYASQMSGSCSVSASVTVSSPGAAQQIDNAVALINQVQIMQQTGNVSSAITVTAKNAVNLTLSDGGISATAVHGATFPGGLPSLASIQQALSNLKLEAEGTGWNGSESTPVDHAKATADAWWNSNFNGSFTLVQLPQGTLGAGGGNITTFSATGDDNNIWALVIPESSVSISVSATQSNK